MHISNVDKAKIIKDMQSLQISETMLLIKMRGHEINRTSMQSIKPRVPISSKVINYFCEIMRYHARKTSNGKGIKVWYLTIWL